METLLSALKAAAEPTRLRLLVLCAHSDLTVSELTQILDQSQPRVSRHLKLLCEAGLLGRTREGSWAYFRLADHGPAAELARTLVDSLPPENATVALDLRRLEGIVAERARLAADYFRRNASKWDEIRTLHVDDTEVERQLLASFPEGEVRDLLDIGTGTGRIVQVCAPRVGRAVGVDLSREMLMVARSNLERAKLRNCMVRHGNMYQLPLSGDSFDVVTLHQVLHYAEQPAAVIREAARVLRPGGRLVVVDFLAHEGEQLRDEHAHRWLGFEPDVVEDWCRDAGLRSEAVSTLPGGELTVGFWTASHPTGQDPRRRTDR